MSGTTTKSTAREQVNKLDQSFSAYVKRQFRKNKLALISMYIAYLLAFIAIFADFIANEKPIVAKYKGEMYFPVLKDYAVKLGLAKWQPEFQNIDWKDLEYDFKIWPPVPYLPQNLDFNNSQYVGPFDEQDVPSKQFTHWLGTDELGRDVLSGMIHGTRIAFLVGIVSMGIASILGIFLGALAGYFGDDRLRMSFIRAVLNIAAIIFGFFYGFMVRSYTLSDAFEVSLINFLAQLGLSFLIFLGFLLVANIIASILKYLPLIGRKINVPVDLIVLRLIEIIVSIPRLILIMAIIAIAKPSILIVMVVIGFTSWTGIARFIRAELLRVRSLEYIEAAESLGFSNFRIMFKHAIPNALSPVFIAIAFGVAAAILIESTLSFLGIGVSADTVTWGSLLSLARKASSAWWLAIFPGFAIFITVTIFNLIGEGLTDALDPRLKQ